MDDLINCIIILSLLAPSIQYLWTVKQSKEKTFPADKMAKQGTPDKNLNFSLALTCKKSSVPPNTNDDGDFADVQVTQKQVTIK